MVRVSQQQQAMQQQMMAQQQQQQTMAAYYWQMQQEQQHVAAAVAMQQAATRAQQQQQAQQHLRLDGVSLQDLGLEDGGVSGGPLATAHVEAAAADAGCGGCPLQLPDKLTWISDTGPGRCVRRWKGLDGKNHSKTFRSREAAVIEGDLWILEQASGWPGAAAGRSAVPMLADSCRSV